MSHIAHIWMCHVTHMDESRDKEGGSEDVNKSFSHIWMSHITYMNESCRTYIGHIGLCRCVYVDLCACDHTGKVARKRDRRISTSHITYLVASCPWMDESCRTYMSLCVSVYLRWCVCVCDKKTGKRVRKTDWRMSTNHVTYMDESCHICERVVSIYEWVMSHIHQWVMSHVHKCVMSHVQMSHVTHMNESCRTYEWVIHTYERVMSHIWMNHSHIWKSHSHI